MMFLPAYQNTPAPKKAPVNSRKGEVSATVLRALASERNMRISPARNRLFSNASMPKALTIRFPEIVSFRMFDTSAAFSWLLRDALFSLRPKRTSGTSTSGIPMRHTSDSRQDR